MDFTLEGIPKRLEYGDTHIQISDIQGPYLGEYGEFYVMYYFSEGQKYRSFISPYLRKLLGDKVDFEKPFILTKEKNGNKTSYSFRIPPTAPELTQLSEFTD